MDPSQSSDLPRVNVVLGGAGARMAAQVGAMSVLRQQYQVQRIAAVSAGVLMGAPLAAGASEAVLYQMGVENSMAPLFEPGKSAREMIKTAGIKRLSGVTTWLAERLQTQCGGTRTFGDLPKLDPRYAAHLAPDDRSILKIRASKDLRPGDRSSSQLWVDGLKIVFGDTMAMKGNAKGAARMRLGVVDFPNDAKALLGPEVDPDQLSIADAAAGTMSQPLFFGPHSDNSGPLHLRLYDGALGLRIPPPNDVFKLANGRADPTPVIGFALMQPGVDPEVQAAEDIRRHPDAIIVRLDPYVTAANGKRTKIGLANFDATREQRDGLFENGREAMTKALETPHAKAVFERAAQLTKEIFGVSYTEPWSAAPTQAPQPQLATTLGR